MPVLSVVMHNFFRDSIQLMRLSEEAKKVAGVEDAIVAMGTPTNKLLMQQMGLLGSEARAAGEGDLVLALKVSGGSDPAGALERVKQLVLAPPSQPSGERTEVFHSIGAAIDAHPASNLAVVSVPGGQAFDPSMELLRRGVNVHLFSDHVPIEQEIKLKKYAKSRGLLVMGPGAGTAIIGGVGLAFANSVRRGNVGIVAAAGTGLQEGSVLLDAVGLGVSEAFGVGGSDVSEKVGGIMTMDCLDRLENDKRTNLIMIIAKAPTEKVMRAVMGYVNRNTSKPVVACFLGLAAPDGEGGRIRYAVTLHSAVATASRLSGRSSGDRFAREISMSADRMLRLSHGLANDLSRGQKFVRGLYSGGTLAHETLLVFRELCGEAYSNTPLTKQFSLTDPATSKEHSIVDMGDEFFTAGRAHPMIDPTLRRLRILQEARDPSVAVIMLDVVLGYGSSPDPAGGLVGAIEEATKEAKKKGRRLIFMAHVCGTSSDPQPLKEQSEKLSNAGVVLFSTNTLMAISSVLVTHGEVKPLRLKWESLVGQV